MKYAQGSYWQEASGAYRAEIRISGTRYTERGKLAREVKAWLSRMSQRKLKEEAAGSVGSDATYSEVAPLLRQRWKTGAERVLSESTRQGYEKELVRVLDYWGTKKLKVTRKSTVEDYVADLRSQGLSTSTIRNRLGRLSQLHAVAVDRGLLDRVPCEVKLPAPRVASKRDEASDDELASWLRSVAGDPRLTLALLLAADCGLRRGEIVRLREEDLDLERGWLHIASRSEKERTKSGKGRDVPLTSRLRRALKEAPDGLVGASSPDALTSRLRRADSSVGLHRLRHRWISKLARAGENPWVLMRLAGHANLQTTLGYYHADGTEPSVNLDRVLGGRIPPKSHQG